LSDLERQILRRWTAKTAYSLNSSSNYLKNIPEHHYRFIKANTNSLPSKVSSFAQQHHGKRAFYWIQSATWVLNGKSDDLAEIARSLNSNSYKISIQFGKLLLLLSYLPEESVYPFVERYSYSPFPKKWQMRLV
jgi:phage-related protein